MAQTNEFVEGFTVGAIANIIVGVILVKGFTLLLNTANSQK